MGDEIEEGDGCVRFEAVEEKELRCRLRFLEGR